MPIEAGGPEEGREGGSWPSLPLVSWPPGRLEGLVGEGLLGRVWHPCGPSPPSSSDYSPWGLVGQLAAHPVSSKGDGTQGCTTTSHQGTKPGPGHGSIQTPSQSGSQGLKEMENFPSGVTNLSSEHQHDAHSPTCAPLHRETASPRGSHDALLPQSSLLWSPSEGSPVTFLLKQYVKTWKLAQPEFSPSTPTGRQEMKKHPEACWLDSLEPAAVAETRETMPRHGESYLL